MRQLRKPWQQWNSPMPRRVPFVQKVELDRLRKASMPSRSTIWLGFACATCLLLPNSASAQTSTWINGGSGGYCFASGNWTGGIPSASSGVFLGRDFSETGFKRIQGRDTQLPQSRSAFWARFDVIRRVVVVNIDHGLPCQQKMRPALHYVLSK
mgnify:CR=1 FL=1